MEVDTVDLCDSLKNNVFGQIYKLNTDFNSLISDVCQDREANLNNLFEFIETEVEIRILSIKQDFDNLLTQFYDSNGKLSYILKKTLLKNLIRSDDKNANKKIRKTEQLYQKLKQHKFFISSNKQLHIQRIGKIDIVFTVNSVRTNEIIDKKIGYIVRGVYELPDSGLLVASASLENRLLLFDQDLNILNRIVQIENVSFSYPCTITGNKKNVVFIADRDNSRIIFTNNSLTNLLKVLVTSKCPECILFDNGRLYVVTCSDRVLEYYFNEDFDDLGHREIQVANNLQLNRLTNFVNNETIICYDSRDLNLQRITYYDINRNLNRKMDVFRESKSYSEYYSDVFIYDDYLFVYSIHLDMRIKCNANNGLQTFVTCYKLNKGGNDSKIKWKFYFRREIEALRDMCIYCYLINIVNGRLHIWLSGDGFVIVI